MTETHGSIANRTSAAVCTIVVAPAVASEVWTSVRVHENVLSWTSEVNSPEPTLRTRDRRCIVSRPTSTDEMAMSHNALAASQRRPQRTASSARLRVGLRTDDGDQLIIVDSSRAPDVGVGDDVRAVGCDRKQPDDDREQPIPPRR